MSSRVSDIQSSSQSITSRYRPEIDGLRAFAVVAVIVNHFNKELLPGGYLGVDIFFVISGYVITSSLFGRHSKDFKDFIGGFYERRIKRLVPALSIFVLITSVLICLFNPDPGVSLWTGMASLFGLSNLYLLKQSTDYFAQTTELNVFTHTWSLGVEEQFYILFPFLVWFSGFGRQTKNGARNLFLIVGALTIASLIGFLYLYPINQPAAYFLMPSRFWEMAVGCLIFIGFQKRASVEQILEKVPPLLLLALIVWVMYLPMSSASASTIAVVALSSILIASLKKQTAAFRVLTDSRVVYVGLISYSLYLWHWSVLSISRWTIGIHWWSVPFQVALMLGLAIASYRWIETPLRKCNWFGKRWKSLVVGGGVLVIVSGGLFALGKPLKGKFFLGSSKPLNTILPAAKPSITRENCMDHESFSIAMSNCWINRQVLSGPRIFFIGDSHNEAMTAAAEVVAGTLGNPVFMHSRRGTPFPTSEIEYHSYGTSDRKKSTEIQRELEKYLLSSIREGDFVFLSLRYPYYFGRDGFSNNEADFTYYSSINNAQISRSRFFQLWQDEVSSFASKISEMGGTLVLNTPTPEWKNYVEVVENCMKAYWFSALGQARCTVRKGEIEKEYSQINSFLLHLSRDNYNVKILDTFSVVCPDKLLCHYRDHWQEYYRDVDHLSNYASRKIAPQMLSIIRESSR